MTLFYRDGKIGFSNIPPIREGLSIKVAGSSENQFFTRHGFIYPLTGLGPDLPSVLEGRVLFDTWYKTSTTSASLIIDRHGALWQADIYIDDDKSYTVDVHSLPQGLGVSWAMSDSEYNRDLIAAILAAGLSDDDTFKQFNEQGVSNGSGFTTMKIDFIVAKLNVLFPEVTQLS